MKFPHCLLKTHFEKWPNAKLISSQALPAPAATDVPVGKRAAASDSAEWCVFLSENGPWTFIGKEEEMGNQNGLFSLANK